MKIFTFRYLLFTAVLFNIALFAQINASKSWQNDFSKKYVEHKDIIYRQAATSAQKLDLYTLKESKEKRPLFIFFHGGGWRKGSKDSTSGQTSIFFKNNWIVANVDYRLLGEALAPAAVIDCRCALHWLVQHADEYGIDKNQIVVGGSSAGGHLALMTGFLPDEHSYNDSCVKTDAYSIKAILNLYGITDVSDILSGANKRGFGRDWLGSQPNLEEVAKSVSPLTYIRPGIPAVLTVHGNADPTVPYSHAVRLDSSLKAAGVKHKFITVEGGLHGKFSREQMSGIYDEIRVFLNELSIPFGKAEE